MKASWNLSLAKPGPILIPMATQGGGDDDTSQDGGQHLDSQDRKALRKAKNRASAAASRARREAYTASLEEEVVHFKRPY